MFKNLMIFVAVMCCCNLINAQNVFSPTDAIVTYKSTAAAGSATNPNQPPWYVMSKWVRSADMSWNINNFKCYIWNGMPFRLRFPNNYNPANATKYPVLIFYHGGGEIGGVYDNEDQLVWGAQLFESRINNGEWNGFMLFPQTPVTDWNDSHFVKVNSILDTLQKYNNSDPDRVITMGLSMGAFGAVYYAALHPDRVAAAISASPANISTLGSPVNFVHVPIWMANGGTDGNPAPYNAQLFYTGFRNAGGNIYQTYFVNNGHNTWTDMWNLKNTAGTYISDTYWNNAHKAQPLVYFQNQQFCDAGPISARMGLTDGFFAYEWQKDGVTIAGATDNEYTATQTGAYRVRFMRIAGGSWSDWTPNPVVVSTKACASDTLFAEHFTSDINFSSGPQYGINNFTCQNGIMTSSTDLFTKDASGVQGSRFLIDFTKSGSSCTYAANDKVWGTVNAIAVSPNTNYEYSFYVGNQNATSLAQLAPAINGTALVAGYIQATGTGTASWKKFTYTWNSGTATTASLSIINRSTVTTGNDFAIDEISFKPSIGTSVGGTLPVTWLQVAAKLADNAVQVSWKIANEVDVTNYIVQRSADGVSFTDIATVNATSSAATEKTYGATDKFYQKGVNYYRVRQTDIDGKYTFSKTVIVNVGETTDFVLLWPNPAAATVNIQNRQTMQRIQCFNGSGQLVYDVRPSANQHAIQVQQWPAGIYYVQITGNNQVSQSRFIKK